jgi:hypothetical protein
MNVKADDAASEKCRDDGFKRAMRCAMLRACEQNEIICSVVILVGVDVVNDFIAAKRSSENLGHDGSVLVDGRTVLELANRSPCVGTRTSVATPVSELECADSVLAS